MRSLPLYNLFALSNFFLCEDEARDGAYGPPEMSGRQISVCVLARRRVLLRLNRIQNLQKPCVSNCDSRNNDEHETNVGARSG